VRLLLGGLVLVVLFLAATLWQRSWTSAARSERTAARGGPSAVENDVPAGWSRVVIGRPSGAEPFRGSGPAIPSGSSNAPNEPALHPTATPAPPPTAQPPPPQAQANEVIVLPGQSLSTICRGHYGTARTEVVEAVARHNRLASADSVREGQTLDLPPLEQLLPKR
jgi:hypothetical protein